MLGCPRTLILGRNPHFSQNPHFGKKPTHWGKNADSGRMATWGETAISGENRQNSLNRRNWEKPQSALNTAQGGTDGSTLEKSEVRALMHSIV